jgi:hypothetical protein
VHAYQVRRNGHCLRYLYDTRYAPRQTAGRLLEKNFILTCAVADFYDKTVHILQGFGGAACTDRNHQRMGLDLGTFAQYICVSSIVFSISKDGKSKGRSVQAQGKSATSKAAFCDLSFIDSLL